MTCHSKLAAELQPLHYWRALRIQSEADGAGSNWMAAFEGQDADNDNVAPPEIEMELREDTAEALLRRLGDTALCEASDGRVLIVGGDIEFSPTTGRLVRAGNLIFADFSKRQPFSKTPMAGQLLGSRTASGSVIPLDLKSRYRPRKSAPPPAAAPITSQEGFEARDELAALLALLEDRSVRVLDEALRAKNLEQLGTMLGFDGDYARKAGKLALLKAVVALVAAQKELAKKIAA